MRLRQLAVPVLIVAASAAGYAQQLTEKIDVRVVNVDVSVTDAKEQPVRGLTKDDFIVLEDGKPQAVTNFYAVESARSTPAAATAAAAAAAPAAPRADTVDPASDARFRRKVLVLIDNAHTSKHGRDQALAKLESFINDRFREGEYEWSIATVGSSVHLVLPLTSDKAAIHDTIAAIYRKAPQQNQRRPAFETSSNDASSSMLGEQSTSMTRRTAWSTMNANLGARAAFGQTGNDVERSIQGRVTVEGIIGAARAFASTEGKKIILLLTGDLGLNDLDMMINDSNGFPERQRNIDERFADISKQIHGLRDSLIAEANASNASFYVINTEGLDAPGDQGVANTQMTNNSAVFWVAEATGGRALTSNDIGKGLQQFDTSSSNFYSLGYRPTHPDDNTQHTIQVRLKDDRGYKLHHRLGYSSVPADVQIGRALASPLAATMQHSDIPVTITTGQPEKQKEGMLVPFAASTPAAKLTLLPDEEGAKARVDVYVSVFDASGRNIVLKRYATGFTSSSIDPGPGNFVYKNALLLRAGQPYRIVVAIRDQATDAVGITAHDVSF